MSNLKVRFSVVFTYLNRLIDSRLTLNLTRMGMGLSIIADSLDRNNDIAEFYAGAGCLVMTVGMLALIAPLVRGKNSEN